MDAATGTNASRPPLNPSSPSLLACPDFSGTPERSVTVYGSSRTQPGTPAWDQAHEVGRLLAAAGFAVITGGYNGSMTAVSQGAAAAAAQQPEHSRITIEGVLVPGLWPDRVLRGNQYLTQETNATSMMDRLTHLTTRSRFYVILPGTLGTLAELALVWCHSYVHPEGLPKPRIFAFREPWEAFVKQTGATLSLPAEQISFVEFVDTPGDVMRLIAADDAELKAAAEL